MVVTLCVLTTFGIVKIFTAQMRQKNKHEQHSVQHPQQVEAREAKIDSTKQPSSVLPHPVQKEENAVYEVVSTTTHIQLPCPNLNHIMRRTTTNLDNSKRVLFSLCRFLSVAVKVDTSERFHRLSLWVGSAGESHGGGREEARIKVAGEAVHQQLGVGGEAISPTIAATVPTEEGERAGLGEEAHTAEQVRLV